MPEALLVIRSYISPIFAAYCDIWFKIDILLSISYVFILHFGCSDRQWSPAHVMPPLDESTPISHTHYWDPAVNALGMLATLITVC